MKLIDDWKTVLGRAWSSRLILLSTVCQFATVVLPFFGMLPNETREVLPAWVFTLLPVALLALALLARVVEQPKLQKKLTKRKMTRLNELSQAAAAERRHQKRLAAAAKLIEEERQRAAADAAQGDLFHG